MCECYGHQVLVRHGWVTWFYVFKKCRGTENQGLKMYLNILWRICVIKRQRRGGKPEQHKHQHSFYRAWEEGEWGAAAAGEVRPAEGMTNQQNDRHMHYCVPYEGYAGKYICVSCVFNLVTLYLDQRRQNHLSFGPGSLCVQWNPMECAERSKSTNHAHIWDKQDGMMTKQQTGVRKREGGERRRAQLTHISETGGYPLKCLKISTRYDDLWAAQSCPSHPSPAPGILTASASAFSRDTRPPATTDSMTATQRCLSGKLGAMKKRLCPGQQGVWQRDSSFRT